MENDKKDKIQTISIDISSDTIQRIETINQQKKWGFDQGIRRIIGAGLGFLEMEMTQKDDPSPNSNTALVKRLIEGESIIASLQYKLYEIETANKNWKLSSGAIQTENSGLRGIAFKHLEIIDTLTRSNIQLKKENLELVKELEIHSAKERESWISSITSRLHKFFINKKQA